MANISAASRAGATLSAHLSFVADHASIDTLVMIVDAGAETSVRFHIRMNFWPFLEVISAPSHDAPECAD